jgi:restriction system protein
MLPLLKLTGDGQTHRFRDTIQTLADHFDLSEQEKKEPLPSGQSKFTNRVGWARTYLAKAGLLESPKRGYFRITEQGRQVLLENPNVIDRKYLEQIDGFSTFLQKKTDGSKPVISEDTRAIDSVETPEEKLESAYQSIRESLATEVLEKVKECSPEFFERLVVDLLVRMGYGGSRREAGEAIGRTGDEGIDGIIKEDRLGLDILYIQAKRWQSVVGRPEVQKFAGALQGQRARKGIFITSSDFTRDALEYVKNIDSKIILIDGTRLAELMMDYNVGVTTEAAYELKRIDSDYYLEE